MGGSVLVQLDLLYGTRNGGEVADYRDVRRATTREAYVDGPCRVNEPRRQESRPARRPVVEMAPRVAGPASTDGLVALSNRELEAIRARTLREQSVSAYHASEQYRRERAAAERET